ncbi:MAG: hypothetical protein N2C14_33200 [Planctomycetales bacterium]
MIIHHYHSFYVGVFIYIPLLLGGFGPWWGFLGIAVCLLTESGQLMDKIEAKREPLLFACTVVAQTMVMFGVFLLLTLMLGHRV